MYYLHEELFESSFESHQKKIIEFCTTRLWQSADNTDILKYAILKKVFLVSLGGGHYRHWQAANKLTKKAKFASSGLIKLNFGQNCGQSSNMSYWHLHQAVEALKRVKLMLLFTNLFYWSISYQTPHYSPFRSPSQPTSQHRPAGAQKDDDATHCWTSRPALD